MNNIRSGAFINSLILISISVLFSSCHKDKADPDYVGTWVTEQAIITGESVLQLKDIVTLTKNSYTDLGQLFDESTAMYIDYIKLIGNQTVNESIMSIDITEIGITTFDIISGKPTGVIQTYKEGTSEFDNIFTQTGQSKSFSFEFSVSGNSLTIYSDNNGDGDYADANETTVYTKQ